MSTKFYAKSPGNEGYIKNMEVLAHHDCDNHYLFQSQLYKTADGKYYLYGGCFFPETGEQVGTLIILYFLENTLKLRDDLLFLLDGSSRGCDCVQQQADQT